MAFYRDKLGLSCHHETDWFVEFDWGAGSYVSIADEQRSRIKSAKGEGITLTMKVEDIHLAHRRLSERGADPEPVRLHGWGAEVFYLYDPEGHRLEIWSEGGV